MPGRRRGVVRLRYAVIALVVTGTALAGAHVAQGDTNKASERLVVYNNNIENMAPCDGNDYTKLIAYMKKQPKSPDIFTVQQISNSKQLESLTKQLSDALPGKYSGRIAIGDPGSMGYTEGCKKRKNQQTNAVVYRTGRLSPEKVLTWRSDAPANPTTGAGKCRNLEPSETSQDRVENVAVRFYDKQSKKRVSVASIHWPTRTWHGEQCADENMREANRALSKLGGSLKIFGGDTNATTPKKDWWNKARGYGFRDPIAEKCGGRVCSDRYNTIGERRIDHILVDSGHGFSHVENITPGMAGGKYSSHRAITAYVEY